MRLAVLLLLLACSSGSRENTAPPDFSALSQLVGRWEGRSSTGYDTMLVTVFEPVGPDVPLHFLVRNDTHGVFVDEYPVVTCDTIDGVAARFAFDEGANWTSWSELVWDREEPQRLLFSGPDSAVLVRVD